MSKVNELTSEEFQPKVLNATGLILVDFYADWCAPCQLQQPILENLANEYDNKLEVFKVDVDRFPEIAQTYEVRGVPTLVLFKAGKDLLSRMGLLKLSDLKTIVEGSV